MPDNNSQSTTPASPQPEAPQKPAKPTKTPQWIRDIATSSEAVGQSTPTPSLPNQAVLPNVSDEPTITKREPERPKLSEQEVKEYIQEKTVKEEKEKEVRDRLLDNSKQVEEDRQTLEKLENEMQEEENKIDQLLKSKFG